MNMPGKPEQKKSNNGERVLIWDVGILTILMIVGAVVLIIEILLAMFTFGKYSMDSVLSKKPNIHRTFKYSKASPETVKVGNKTPIPILKTKDNVATGDSKFSGYMKFGPVSGTLKGNNKIVYYVNGDAGYVQKAVSYDKAVFRKNSSNSNKATVTDGQRSTAKINYLSQKQAQVILNQYRKENGFSRWLFKPFMSEKSLKADLRKNTYTAAQVQKKGKSYNRQVLAGKLSAGSYPGSYAKLVKTNIKVFSLPKSAFDQNITF